MTPVHAQLHGQSLQMVGVVISAHMLGMFALSPLSGWLADWRGGASAICFGVGTLATASVVAATADPADTVGLSFGVFLLGLGWNLCWVGGSSLLARQGAAQVEGDADAVVWTTSTAASLLSGRLLATGGYGLVVGVGGAVALMALLPLTVMRVLAKRDWLDVKEIKA
jgi:MFS family permease